jgi:glyoxylase-like metal-dependent hydrolase (beta-lactamase superfamily II)
MQQSLPIIPISLPTPWPSVGPVHVYLIRQDPVTLIDTGLTTPESREALLDGLRAAHVELKDIRRVLLTHVHLDHAGQAGWIQEASGAEVRMHPDEVGKAEMPDWWYEGRDQTLWSAGVPAETQQLMDHYWRQGRSMTGPLGDWLPLTDGESLAFAGFELEAVHLPGHALGHTGFWQADHGVLIGGDHLLEGVTPNPILEPLPGGHPAGVGHAPYRALTLGQFLGSLDRVAQMPVKRVLPGHGPVITDHRAMTGVYKAKHERRLGLLLQRIAAGSNAYAVTREVFPRVREFDIFLALSEIMAHLDLLVVRGWAAMEPGAAAGGADLYRAVPGPQGLASV